MVPVRVASDIPKELIFAVMEEINAVTVKERLGRGDAVIKNVAQTGVDVIITSDILKWGGKKL